MLEILQDYIDILFYLCMLGGIASVADNLIHKRKLTLQIQSFVFYAISFLLGSIISGGIYLVCEIVFFLPFYVQIPLSVLCAYWSFDILFASNTAKKLYKNLQRIPISALEVEISHRYKLLSDTKVGDFVIPKGFYFTGFKKYFLLSYICPSDYTTIGAFMAYEYLQQYDNIKAKNILLAILLSKKGIFATIIAFVCYIHLSIVDKNEQDNRA